MERTSDTELVYDPEPPRYYDWILWMMRQERNNMSDDILNDPTDDVTKGNLSGWIEKPHISKDDLFSKEIAEMQKTNHLLMMRIKEQAEEIDKLKKKIDAKL